MRKRDMWKDTEKYKEINIERKRNVYESEIE